MTGSIEVADWAQEGIRVSTPIVTSQQLDLPKYLRVKIDGTDTKR